jgi:hypothetical protein
VYELFRKLGCKPSGRAALETDPGPLEMLHYKAFEFKNDETFKRARQCMEFGYLYCPEKGHRDRKHLNRARIEVAES